MATSEKLPGNSTELPESVECECKIDTNTLLKVGQKGLSAASDAVEDELCPAGHAYSCPSGDEIGITTNEGVPDKKLEYNDAEVGHAVLELGQILDTGPLKDLVQDVSQDSFEDALSELEYSSCVSLDLTTGCEVTVKDVGTQSEKSGFHPDTSKSDDYQHSGVPAAPSPQHALAELATQKTVDKCLNVDLIPSGAGLPNLPCGKVGACNKHGALLPDEYDQQYRKVLSARLQHGNKPQEPLCDSCSRSMMQYISAIQGLLQNLSIDMVAKGSNPPACSWCARERISQAFQNACRSDTDFSSVFSPNLDSDLPVSRDESVAEQDTSPRSPRDRRGRVDFMSTPATNRSPEKSPEALPRLTREYGNRDRGLVDPQQSLSRELAYNGSPMLRQDNPNPTQPWHETRSPEGERGHEQHQGVVHHEKDHGTRHEMGQHTPHEQDEPTCRRQLWTHYKEWEKATHEKHDQANHEKQNQATHLREDESVHQSRCSYPVDVNTCRVEQAVTPCSLPPNPSDGGSPQHQNDHHQRNGLPPDVFAISLTQPHGLKNGFQQSEDIPVQLSEQQHSPESLRTGCTELPTGHSREDVQGRPSDLPLQVYHSSGGCSDTRSSNESGNVTGKAAVRDVPHRRHGYPVRQYVSGAGQLEEFVQQELIEPCKPTVTCQAYVTMASNDLSAMLCLVLGNSLRLSETKRSLVVLITDGVSPAFRHMLSSVFNVVQSVRSLGTHGTTKLALLEQPDIGVSFTKLHAWRMTQFSKCVFLDAATLVVQHCDELFDREELSAVPDTGWPDCFNSGVFVYTPSMETFWDLISFAERQGSFDGGDQGLLNMYFRNWSTDISRRLPFIYNLMANVSYTYKPAFKQFGKNVKIVQFFGGYKPWNVKFHAPTGQMSPAAGVHSNFAQFVQLWLRIYVHKVLPMFSQSIQDKAHRAQYICALDLLQHFPSFLTSEPVVTLPTPSFRSHPKPIIYLPPGPRLPPEMERPHAVPQLGVERSAIVPSPQPPTELPPPPKQADVETTSESKDVPENKDSTSSKEGLREREQGTVNDLSGMLAWEQGRADYMGEHKSDNIMARLDRLISGVPE